MTLPPWPLLILLGIGAVMTAILAITFYRDPIKGMTEATHLPEKLPLVMIDRYIGITIIQVGLILFGSLEMIAMFCLAGIVMGFGDGLIYARAGHSHAKHTASGLLALTGFAVSLYYISGAG